LNYYISIGYSSLIIKLKVIIKT
ncbi:hypothetical protein FPSE_06388, partial [Fusarium pseudograminearum CS3096]